MHTSRIGRESTLSEFNPLDGLNDGNKLDDKILDSKVKLVIRQSMPNNNLLS